MFGMVDERSPGIGKRTARGKGLILQNGASGGRFTAKQVGFHLFAEVAGHPQSGKDLIVPKHHLV
jgi:hypothetical protein